MYKKDYGKIPKELKDIKSWVLWTFMTVKDKNGKDKETKVPKDINNKKTGVGGIDKYTGLPWSRNYMSFEDVVMAVHLRPKEFDGIGFCFTTDNGYFGIDLDDCFTDREINEYGYGKLKEVDSYAEVSPSGEGIHIIGKMKEFQERGRKTDPIEFYTDKRFFTFTGNVIPGYETIKEVKWIQELHDRFFPKDTAVEDSYKDNGMLSAMSEDEVMDMFNSSLNSITQRVRGLYHSGWYPCSEYESQSNADLALIGKLLYYTNGDRAMTDKLFRESALYREKWERVDYRDMTFNKAFSTFKPHIHANVVNISFEENEQKQKEAEEKKTEHKETIKVPDYIWSTGCFAKVAEATGTKDWATLIGALSAFGALAAKSVIVTEKQGFPYSTSMYILSAAPSGSGKSMIAKVCSDLIKSAGELQTLDGEVKHISILSSIASGQVLQESLIRLHPVTDAKGKEKLVPSKASNELLVLNEEFQQICSMMSISGGTLETILNELYMRVTSYSIEKMALKREYGVTGGRLVLDRPIVSVLGTMVSAQFAQSFDTDTKRSSGLFNRFLVLPCDKKEYDDGFGENDGSEYKEDVINQVSHDFINNVSDTYYDFNNKKSHEVFEDKAIKIFQEQEWLSDLWEGEDEGNRRSKIHVKGIAIIFAIADGRGKVNEMDVKKAVFIVKASIQTKARLFEEGRENITTNQQMDLQFGIEAKIMKKIKEAGGRIMKRELIRSVYTKKIPSKQIGDILVSLEKNDYILLESVDNFDKNGKETKPELWIQEI